MYGSKTLIREMETCTSDTNDECLVTDLVNELSSGLEIPFLLSENNEVDDKTESISQIHCGFYEEPLKENWREEPYFNFTNNCESIITLKNKINNDLENFFEKDHFARTHSTGGFSGSGSECSSVDFLTTKIELDTPPVTPPDERTSPENAFFLPSDEYDFMPVCVEGNLQKDNKNKSINKTVRICPKPISTTFNIFDSQALDVKAAVCNVFSDVNTISLRSHDISSQSNAFFNSSNGKKKSLLDRKDLEFLQAKRKQERMIRNRESAYLSRKRKKEHVAHLEKQVQDLQAENKQLKMENCSLKQRLARYEDLEPGKVHFSKKSGNLFTESPRKTTALLALLFTVCLNIGSFSTLINERKVYKNDNELIKESIVPNYPSSLRHSRSLLWADNDLGSSNSTYANLTKTSCLLSVNQTESIRLESELRRWIGIDEDYSRKAKYNLSRISQYFYLGERPFQNKNVIKRKIRPQKSSPQKKNLKMDMYRMNILNFNTFFEAIHRRDDTFYLVSFSSDHLLLPALSHNQTSRPKMSLMLPASFSNGTGADQVEMMQIDCEVTNTQLLSVNENDIPSHMRPYSNSTTRSKSKTKAEAKKFGDYFVSDLPVTLIPAKKINFKAEKNSLIYQNSSDSRGASKNMSQSNESDTLSFQHSRLNFNFSRSNDFEEKTSFLQYKNFFFTNQTYKQDQSSVHLFSSSGNLLKLLMLGPVTTNPKAIKIKDKSFYKNYRNTTKNLIN